MLRQNTRFFDTLKIDNKVKYVQYEEVEGQPCPRSPLAQVGNSTVNTVFDIKNFKEENSNMKRRLLAGLLTCVMLFSLLPATALADETDEESAETAIESVEPATEETVTPEEEEPAEPEAPAEVTEEPQETSATDISTDGATAQNSDGVLYLTDTEPMLTGMTISGNIADTTGGSLCLSIPNVADLAGASISLTTNEAVTFQTTSEAQTGELYASSASNGSVTLRFAITTDQVDMNTDAYSINLTSTDNVNWTGTFSSGFDMNATTLAAALNLSNASLRAGTMLNAAGTGNTASSIYCNEDAGNIQMVLCDTSVERHTVTYHYGTSSYVWSVPDGAKLVRVTLPTNLVLENWYTDAGHTTLASFGGTVTADVDLYANLITAEDASDFAKGLEDGDEVLYIKGLSDWTSFVNNSSQVSASQRVELLSDIDCGGASYTALVFAGDFNGNNRTISNATFNASGDYSGMFKNIGGGQKICNLTLSNITAKYATYAGALGGSAGGNALIQNVQVRDCSVSGRSAGGLVGLTDYCTIQYCSNRGSSVTGIANGAGIVGINYANVLDCYSTVSPTALSSSGRGGISGKNLESGSVTWSWCTSSSIAGTPSTSDMNNKVSVTSASPVKKQMQQWGSARNCWIFAVGSNSDFDQTAITYLFNE